MEGGESHPFEKQGINSLLLDLRIDGAIEWGSRKKRMSLDAPLSSSSRDFSLEKSLSCSLNLMERETVEAEETDANMMAGELRSRFKRICVFCGSSSGNRTVFSDSALALGHELVKRRIDLVYGGGSAGLMGLVSRAVYDGGCHVLGVIPTALLPIEISGQTVGEVKTVSDMHERKAEMARRSDAFIALPGGYGTMEELLEMIAWSQLGIHSKPVGLLNVDGYYNSLLALFDNGVEEGFIHPTARHIVISATTAKELLVKMEQYTPLHEQVAPRTNWEIARLGYSMPPSPP